MNHMEDVFNKTCAIIRAADNLYEAARAIDEDALEIGKPSMEEDDGGEISVISAVFINALRKALAEYKKTKGK